MAGSGSRRRRATSRRTTHVVEFLRTGRLAPARDLRDAELAVLGWRSGDGEAALICRLMDGISGTIPARWTDLPARRAVQLPLGWSGRRTGSLLGERLGGLRERCPGRGRAWRNGGVDVRPVGAATGEQVVAAAVWETLPADGQRAAAVGLARLGARVVEAERDERGPEDHPRARSPAGGRVCSRVLARSGRGATSSPPPRSRPAERAVELGRPEGRWRWSMRTPAGPASAATGAWGLRSWSRRSGSVMWV